MKKTIAIVLATIMLLMSIAMAETTVDVDMDIDEGDIEIEVENTEAGVHFEGFGSFGGNFNSAEQGNYLDTNVLVGANSWASFSFSGYQELSGYTSNSVVIDTFAYGEDTLMNNRFDNSNYIVQLERVDTGLDFLSASNEYGIGWRMMIDDGEDSSAGASVELYGDGSGAFDTNQWHSTSIGSYGWGNPDSISAPSLPSYYTPTNTVSATGEGQFIQTGYGDNSLEMNGFVFGSGTGTFVANFDGGFSGTYTTRAN